MSYQYNNVLDSHCANNTTYYEFLHIETQELMKIMDEKRNKIDFLSEYSNTNEKIALSNAFIMYVEKNLVVHINDVSFKLIEIYILNCDEEEALVVCDAMQKLESQRSITKETTDTLTQEKSIEPQLITSLIDEIFNLQLSNNSSKKSRSPDRTKRCQPKKRRVNNRSKQLHQQTTTTHISPTTKISHQRKLQLITP